MMEIVDQKTESIILVYKNLFLGWLGSIWMTWVFIWVILGDCEYILGPWGWL